MPKVPMPLRQPKSRAMLCTAVMENGLECQQPVAPEAPTSFCTLHGLLAAQWMIGHHRDLVDRILAVEVAQERSVRKGPRFDKYLKVGVVYYVRFSGSIKIGTTTDLPQRMRDLPVEEILAVEPGGTERERVRHAQFRPARITGEWFRPVPELLFLATSLRAQYGEPMAFWEQVATRRSA